MPELLELGVENPNGGEALAEASHRYLAFFRVLLADADPTEDGELRASLPAACRRAELVLAFISQHPRVAGDPVLTRYTLGMRQWLADVLNRHGEDGWISVVAEDDDAEYTAQELRDDWQALSAAIASGDYEAFCAVAGVIDPEKAVFWENVIGQRAAIHPFFWRANADFAGDYLSFKRTHREHSQHPDEQHLGGGLWRIRSDAGFGVQRDTGADTVPLLPPHFEKISSMSEDDDAALHLVSFRQNGRWGIADCSQTPASILVDACIDELWAYEDGLAIMRIGEHEGLLDLQGRQIIPPIYDYIGEGRDGLYPVEQNELWGLRHRDGRELCAPRYASLELLDQHIWVNEQMLPPFFQATSDAGLGLLDASGREILPCAFDEIEWSRSFCAWRTSKDEQFALYHPDGTPWLPASRYDPQRWLIENVLLSVAADNREGLMTPDGQLLVPCIHEQIERCDFPPTGEPTLLVKNKNGWMLLDSAAQPLLPERFRQISLLTEYNIIRSHPDWRGLLRVNEKGQDRLRGKLEGIWHVAEPAPRIACNHTAIQPVLLDEPTRLFFLAVRPCQPDEDATQHPQRFALYHADGSRLFSDDYAWLDNEAIRTAQELTRLVMRLKQYWGQAEAVIALNAGSGQLERLHADGRRESA